MLYDARSIPEDELAALQRDSLRHGTTLGEIDFALVVDGLEAEREQNITIDVAYRFFGTPRWSFIVIDAPGHEQYTRNMATGSSDADVAVIVVDVRNGVVPQTKRHSYICALMGIRHVILAVNKLDLVGYAREHFENICEDYEGFTDALDFASITTIPVSALFGDNVTRRSRRTPWYSGPTLIECLESIDVECAAGSRPFRMPVQWVNRPNLDFRGFSGSVVSGTIAPGDRVVSRISGLLLPIVSRTCVASAKRCVTWRRTGVRHQSSATSG